MYYNKKFTINQICNIIYRVVKEARQELIGLIIVDINKDKDVNKKQVPLIN
jgi:hypothetical protein